MAFPPNSIKNDPLPEHEFFSVIGAWSRKEEEQPQLAHLSPVAEVRLGKARKMVRADLVNIMTTRR